MFPTCPAGLSGNPFDNREFRDEFSKVLEEKLDDKLTPLVKTVEQHSAELSEHTKLIEHAKGATMLVKGFWAAILIGADFLLRRWMR